MWGERFSFSQAGTRKRSFLYVVDTEMFKYVPNRNMKCNKVYKRAEVEVVRLKRAEHVEIYIILRIL
jgi:hypothetical protein